MRRFRVLSILLVFFSIVLFIYIKMVLPVQEKEFLFLLKYSSADIDYYRNIFKRLNLFLISASIISFLSAISLFIADILFKEEIDSEDLDSEYRDEEEL